MRVLITGGAGYIGSHTTKLLARAGVEPVVVDNLSAGHRWAAKWGTFIEGELSDRHFLQGVLREYSVDAVVHFAAKTYVGESMSAPGLYFESNTINTLNLLNAMQATGVNNLVFSSTAATYGNPMTSPIPEDHVQEPVNPYGESKLLVERALRWYQRAYGLNWVALRYFNAAGADEEGEIGEAHDPETHLIPLVIQTALGQRPFVDMFGTDYPTPDGTAIRDYVHVTDLAQAHFDALSYLSRGGQSAAFNLGTGRGHSVREVIDAVKRASDRPVPVRERDRRPGDPPVLVANPAKAVRELGWRPNRSSLDHIVETAWRWHSSRMAERYE